MFLHLLGIESFLFYLLEFCFAAGIVLFSGSKLAGYGDKIASGSKFSSGWIGFILLAFITSLPELMTGISSTAIVKSVDLVLSDTIGSNAVNIVILAGMFFFISKKRQTAFSLKKEELITGFAGLFMLGLVGVFLIANPVFHLENLSASVSQGISIGFSIAIVIAYLSIVIIAFKIGGLSEEEGEEGGKEKHIGLKFTLLALIIIIASIWMTKTAGLVAEAPIGARGFTLGKTLVGGLLLAIATSLPEMSVTFAAARMGNTSMAVGNIFGSNIFNIFVIPIAALFYRGNFWKDLSSTNIYWVFITLLVTAVVGMDLIAKAHRKTTKVSALNILTILLWICGVVVVFMVK